MKRMTYAILALFIVSVIAAMIGHFLPQPKIQRGPIDAVVDHMPVCAAAKQDTGNRIVLDGVLRGPCNSTDVGRKP